MQLHLVKGRAEMQKQTVEAAEGAVAGLKADLAPAEGDRQHFVNSLADAMHIFLSYGTLARSLRSGKAMRSMKKATTFRIGRGRWRIPPGGGRR